jgi:hypothetical protein
VAQADDKDRSTGASPEAVRRARTLQGVPVPDGRAANRVTLDFSGPPLPLPGEPVSQPVAEAKGPQAAGTEAPLEGRDAWIVERARRASEPSSEPPVPTVPPSRGVRGASYSDLALGADVAGPREDDAIGLVDRSRASLAPADLAAEMRDRFALDDFTGSLRAAELLLGKAPDHAEAQRYAESSRARLEQLYSSRLGGSMGVPRVVVDLSEARWLGIDHRAGFLLSRIDGAACLEDILDMCCMPRLEALKLLIELLEAGAVRVDRA